MKFFPFVSQKKYEELLDFLAKSQKEKRELETKLMISEYKIRNILEMVRTLGWDEHSCIINAIVSDNSIIFVERKILFDNQFTLNLHVLEHSISYGCGKLFASFNDEQAYLEDIQCSPNQGHGSILLDELIKFCKYNKIKRITGTLAKVDLEDAYDSEHKSRLIHFYTKHGFIIRDNLNPISKKISLNL